MHRSSACVMVLGVTLLLACGHTNMGWAQIPDTLSLKRGVVKIMSAAKGQAEEVGAGVIISRQGDAVYILTAAHVLQEGDHHPRVSFYSQPLESMTVDKMVGIEKRLSASGGREVDPEGVAVLAVKGHVPSDASVLPLAKSTEHLQGGEDVMAIGFPVFQDKGWMVSTGSMSSEGGGQSLIFSADITGGNSGGPLIHNGSVVGVVMVSMAKRQAMAVSIEKVRSMLREWKVPMESSMTVMIPQGPFAMGINEKGAQKSEGPIHIVQVSAFLIDQYETTTAEYREFLQTSRRSPPIFWEQVLPGRDDRKPVIGLSWGDAKAYCEWAGKRLPTEAEWEKAARGVDKRVFPWGADQPAKHLANYDQLPTVNPYDGGVLPAGRFEAGKSPFGVYDMAGNAWEWVADWYDEQYYSKSPGDNPKGPVQGKKKVLRGGSWLLGDLRTTARDSAHPEKATETFGVRCAKDAK